LHHFRCKEFYPLVLWIWNQNIAISTIVGTSSHNTPCQCRNISRMLQWLTAISPYIYFIV
jgi:hypothetical protein